MISNTQILVESRFYTFGWSRVLHGLCLANRCPHFNKYKSAKYLNLCDILGNRQRVYLREGHDCYRNGISFRKIRCPYVHLCTYVYMCIYMFLTRLFVLNSFSRKISLYVIHTLNCIFYPFKCK